MAVSYHFHRVHERNDWMFIADSDYRIYGRIDGLTVPSKDEPSDHPDESAPCTIEWAEDWGYPSKFDSLSEAKRWIADHADEIFPALPEPPPPTVAERLWR